MADHGLKLYGNAIIVNTDFASSNAKVVKSFLGAVGKGWKDAVSNPSSAIDALVKRNPAADKKLEERRFNLALTGNVMTDYVIKNGMGNIDKARFEAAIAQLSETYKYKTKPNAKLYFTDAYLPKGGFKLK
jgi:NitT/TauT family transport system substrate-binding protein